MGCAHVWVRQPCLRSEDSPRFGLAVLPGQRGFLTSARGRKRSRQVACRASDSLNKPQEGLIKLCRCHFLSLRDQPAPPGAAGRRRAAALRAAAAIRRGHRGDSGRCSSAVQERSASRGASVHAPRALPAACGLRRCCLPATNQLLGGGARPQLTSGPLLPCIAARSGAVARFGRQGTLSRRRCAGGAAGGRGGLPGVEPEPALMMAGGAALPAQPPFRLKCSCEPPTLACAM